MSACEADTSVEAPPEPSPKPTDPIEVKIPSDDICEIDLARLIPDPYEIFPDDKFSYSLMSDEIDSHGFVLSSGVNYEMYQKYRLACRRGGFTRVQLEQDGLYWANDEENIYFLQIYYMEIKDAPDESYLMVSINIEEG